VADVRQENVGKTSLIQAFNPVFNPSVRASSGHGSRESEKDLLKVSLRSSYCIYCGTYDDDNNNDSSLILQTFIGKAKAAVSGTSSSSSGSKTLSTDGIEISVLTTEDDVNFLVYDFGGEPELGCAEYRALFVRLTLFRATNILPHTPILSHGQRNLPRGFLLDRPQPEQDRVLAGEYKSTLAVSKKKKKKKKK
jgi:hypothetical protein